MTRTVLRTTPEARSVIRRVSGHPRLGKDSGLRIADAAASPAPLQVRPAPEPGPGDVVVDCDGGRIFLGGHVAHRVLDAVTERGGRVQIILRGHG